MNNLPLWMVVVGACAGSCRREPSNENLRPPTGTLQAGVYENPFFGMRLPAPAENWLAVSATEIQEQMVERTQNAAGDAIDKVRDELAASRSVALVSLRSRRDPDAMVDFIALKKRFWTDGQFAADMKSMLVRTPGLEDLGLEKPRAERLGGREATCVSGQLRVAGNRTHGKYCAVRFGHWTMLVYQGWGGGGSSTVESVLRSLTLSPP